MLEPLKVNIDSINDIIINKYKIKVKLMTRTTHHTPHYESTSKGNFNLAYHVEMLSDRERVEQFKKGIDKIVTKDSVFCELGCGTGVFSIYAAQTAKKVYAIEFDEEVYKFAKKNIEASGLTNIELIHGDAMQVELPEKVDVIFAEMMSIWMIHEPQLVVMNSAVKRFLKPNGVTIPEKVVNLIELCNTDYVYDNIEMRASIAQFTGIKQPRVMSESKIFDSYKLKEKNDESVDKSINITTMTSGIVNAVRLTSLVKICDGVNFYSTDSLMPQTIMPLEEDIEVKDGEKVELHAKFRFRSELDEAKFTLIHT